MLASIQEALLRVKWNSEPKVQCLVPSEGSVNACTSCFLNLVQRGSQAWHQKFTDSFGLAWTSNRSTYMSWETLCKDMVCWLFFEGKMKYDYGNTRPTLQKKMILITPCQVPYPCFCYCLVLPFLLPEVGGGVGLRFLLYGPLELGSFYCQGMFLKFMCNIRMRNSLRACNVRGDDKPWH